jgi:hypothetical protein
VNQSANFRAPRAAVAEIDGGKYDQNSVGKVFRKEVKK